MRDRQDLVQSQRLHDRFQVTDLLGNFAFGGNSLARHPDTFILRLRFRTGGGRMGAEAVSIVPCRATSSHETNKAGILKNNYQPRPVFGQDAARTAALVLTRSAGLRYGLKTVDYLKLR